MTMYMKHTCRRDAGMLYSEIVAIGMVSPLLYNPCLVCAKAATCRVHALALNV